MRKPGAITAADLAGRDHKVSKGDLQISERRAAAAGFTASQNSGRNVVALGSGQKKLGRCFTVSDRKAKVLQIHFSSS